MPREGGAPTVSIVTPVYNTATWLAECLEGSLAQTYRDFELVVSDNASTDGSLAIAESFAARDPRVRIHAHPQHLPQTENFNRALGLAHPGARYVKMVLADDRLQPSCVERLVRVAETHPRVGLVSSLYLESGRVVGRGLPADRESFDGRAVCREQLLEGSFYFGSNSVVLYRAAVVRESAPLYDARALHADTDAAYRILTRHDLGFVHEALVTLRVDDDSISGAVRDLNPRGLDKLGVILRYGPVFLSDAEYRACLEAHEAKYYRAYARGLFGPRRAEFVAYHRRGHARLGYRLSSSKLAVSLVREIGGRIPWLRSRS